MHPAVNTVNWQKALEAANKARRCGARTRAAHPCKSPAMPNGRCRMHGGKSPGAPCGKDHGRYKNGKHTNEIKKQKKEFREAYRILNINYPIPKASDTIYLEDTNFEISKRRKTWENHSMTYGLHSLNKSFLFKKQKC